MKSSHKLLTNDPMLKAEADSEDLAPLETAAAARSRPSFTAAAAAAASLESETVLAPVFQNDNEDLEFDRAMREKVSDRASPVHDKRVILCASGSCLFVSSVSPFSFCSNGLVMSARVLPVQRLRPNRKSLHPHPRLSVSQPLARYKVGREHTPISSRIKLCHTRKDPDTLGGATCNGSRLGTALCSTICNRMLLL